MVVQRGRCVSKQTELQIQPLGWEVLAGMHQQIATLDLVYIDTGKVYGNPAARHSGFFLLFMRLQPPDAGM
jgi:hypothetical protein